MDPTVLVIIAVALVVFAVMFTLSAFVIGPLINSSPESPS
jgi:phage shock protein PspC (stress-responsive transcriptional regulator)